MRLNKRILISISTFFLLIFGSSVTGEVKGDIHKTFKVQKEGLLTIEADIGSIEINTTKDDEVDIVVDFDKRRGSSSRLRNIMKNIDVNFHHSGRDVRVDLEYDRGLGNFWNSVGRYLRVKFMVTVPEEYNVDIHTSGGSISVDDLEGEVTSRTSGGSLYFGEIAGQVYGKTSGGSITLHGCKEEVKVETSGGSIDIGEVSGNVVAHTSGGSIKVEEVMGAIDARTSGGSVTAYISKQPRGNCSLKTSGGTVTAYLARDVKVTVDAHTSGGRVHTDFPVMVRGTLNKRSLNAEINGGGPELYLRTSGGSIYIKER
ncbi:MAG: DUF4097 family beta strand repeat-containing protein [bacterium]